MGVHVAWCSATVTECPGLWSGWRSTVPPTAVPLSPYRRFPPCLTRRAPLTAGPGGAAQPVEEDQGHPQHRPEAQAVQGRGARGHAVAGAARRQRTAQRQAQARRWLAADWGRRCFGMDTAAAGVPRCPGACYRHCLAQCGSAGAVPDAGLNLLCSACLPCLPLDAEAGRHPGRSRRRHSMGRRLQGRRRGPTAAVGTAAAMVGRGAAARLSMTCPVSAS